MFETSREAEILFCGWAGIWGKDERRLIRRARWLWHPSALLPNPTLWSASDQSALGAERVLALSPRHCRSVVQEWWWVWGGCLGVGEALALRKKEAILVIFPFKKERQKIPTQ